MLKELRTKSDIINVIREMLEAGYRDSTIEHVLEVATGKVVLWSTDHNGRIIVELF